MKLLMIICSISTSQVWFSVKIMHFIHYHLTLLIHFDLHFILNFNLFDCTLVHHLLLHYLFLNFNNFSLHLDANFNPKLDKATHFNHFIPLFSSYSDKIHNLLKVLFMFNFLLYLTHLCLLLIILPLFLLNLTNLCLLLIIHNLPHLHFLLH